MGFEQDYIILSTFETFRKQIISSEFIPGIKFNEELRRS